jgi:hypothetical protein
LEGWKPFAEAGGWTTSSARYSFMRTYLNGEGTATGVGGTDGSDSYHFGRLGAAFDLSPGDEAAVSGEIGRAELSTDPYTELLSNIDPFEAHARAGHDSFTVGKARAQWRHAFSDRFDGEAWVAGNWESDYRTDFSAVVPGFGLVIPGKAGSQGWVEYGVRAGYAVSDRLTADVFVDGVSGSLRVGSEAHFGIDIRYKF